MYFGPIEQHPGGFPPANFPWYAVRVQSKYECIASTTLRSKGYEEFLPLYESRRRWSDRIQHSKRALFPGYLFCRFDATGRLLPILTTPGVIGIVCAGKQPIPIDEEEIAAIETVIRSGLASQPWPHLVTGCRVFIEDGPLAGIEGLVTGTEKKYRLIVSVTMLQRSVAVEIDREWVRPVPQSRRIVA